jgi:hypothetical protein
MSAFQSRRFILVFVASAVAVGSLLAPETAPADTALFRVEQRWHMVSFGSSIENSCMAARAT